MAEQHSIYGTFKELIDSIDPTLRPICLRLRQIIAELHADCTEIVWMNQRIASYGVGPKKMSEHYVYIAAHKAHVNLGFYYGTALPDPEGLLDGTGKHLRHIKLRRVAEAESPHIRRLIQEAILDRQQAFT